MAYENLREESQKLKVAADWFPKFDCTDIIKRIDFAVKIKRDAASIDFEDEYLLWAEAKQQPTDVYQMLAQLILTIRADAYDRVPPKFIGCFDCEKIAFIEYHYVLPIHNVNDFNWKQTPSAVDAKTIETVRNTINANRIFTFYFDTDRTELKNFIKANFNLDSNTNLFSTLIDKNNFIFVYQKWQKMVIPYIAADWDLLKKNYSVYDRDFFLAELNIDDNGTTEAHDDKIVNRDFYITFDAKSEKPYQLKRTDNFGMEFVIPFGFKKDGLRHYTDFWKRYRRPPQNEYWDYIVERVDLLVPQDVRERKGSFFTPQKWVEKSQQYLSDVLGENWQDEYYIWDCCAGTGNMEVGLTNKYNVWASTIDQQDVDVMHERIRNGAQLLDNHVFQFDFLNDDFNSEKVPEDLKRVISDPEKRKKLVIYINPPYAEGTTATTVTGTGSNKAGVATSHKTYEKYKNIIGKATNEVYAQFFIRVYKELPSAMLAEFSTMKLLQSISFKEFRKVFQAKLEKAFVVPSKTFDNVNGDFPIGFLIWNTQKKEVFSEILTDAFDAQENYIGQRKFQVDDENSLPINNWVRQFSETKENAKGLLDTRGNDFANQRYVYITHQSFVITAHSMGIYISEKNILPISIYLAVRQIIPARWLNNKDQFLFPNDGWKVDAEFQTNCLIYTLFHGQNKISVTQDVNHWIPFSESEVNAKERFESHFMIDFLAGKIVSGKPKDLFTDASVETQCNASLQFTDEAKAVLDAGRDLWRYYHQQPDANVNASLYDIKEYFKGRDKNGRMKKTSDDAQYNELFYNLQVAMKRLGASIQPKVYEYGFLK
ncbi:MAG: hypothetical protein IKW77_09955 [Salinivirgaceae bacterium]|nr:hypothetical protein [Salinivirgaceae bacterium]